LRARWLREFLTHGPSLTPDPIRNLKGKGQRDPKPLARKQRHSLSAPCPSSSVYGQGSERDRGSEIASDIGVD
jgi:hypothetical protein